MHETAASDPSSASAGNGSGGLDESGLGIEVVEGVDGAVVSLRGELDLASAPQLERELAALVAGGLIRLTVDLAGVTFLDSSGLGALYRTQQAADEHSVPLRLVAVPDHVVRVLDVTAMAPLFDIE